MRQTAVSRLAERWPFLPRGAMPLRWLCRPASYSNNNDLPLTTWTASCSGCSDPASSFVVGSTESEARGLNRTPEAAGSHVGASIMANSLLLNVFECLFSSWLKDGSSPKANPLGSHMDLHTFQIPLMTRQNASLGELCSNPMSFCLDQEEEKLMHVVTHTSPKSLSEQLLVVLVCSPLHLVVRAVLILRSTPSLRLCDLRT